MVRRRMRQEPRTEDAVIAQGATPAEQAVLRELWRITASGNNAEVRQRDGRLVVYEVRKNITVG